MGEIFSSEYHIKERPQLSHHQLQLLKSARRQASKGIERQCHDQAACDWGAKLDRSSCFLQAAGKAGVVTQLGRAAAYGCLNQVADPSNSLLRS